LCALSKAAISLAACHATGMAHRDIKLENFMVRKEKLMVKLIDFGYAETPNSIKELQL
jgi:serine/threonine protein kinase